MRLSHKNKLLHKKGIPQRAWIGRHNRRFLRDVSKIESVLNKSKHGECRRSFLMRGIWGRQKRTGKLCINKVKTYERFDRVDAKEPGCIPTPEGTMNLPFRDEVTQFDMPNEIEGKALLPERESGGFISPEVGLQVVTERELRAVITPNDKETIQKLYGNRQQTIINRVVVTAKEEEANAGSVLSAIARSAVRVGTALKGVFFSKSKEKDAL
ncbi:TPA: hypothetical protein ACF334_004440 [Vibrio parahaemolyticus]